MGPQHAFTNASTKIPWQEKVKEGKKKKKRNYRCFTFQIFVIGDSEADLMKPPYSPWPWSEPVKLGSIFLVIIPIILSWEEDISKKVCSILEMLMGWQLSPKSF